MENGKAGGRRPTESPDSNEPEQGDRCRLAIGSVSSSGEFTRLAVVPANTVTSLFVWVAPVNLDKVVLRINDSDGKFSNNPDGGVQYRLHIVKPTNPLKSPINSSKQAGALQSDVPPAGKKHPKQLLANAGGEAEPVNNQIPSWFVEEGAWRRVQLSGKAGTPIEGKWVLTPESCKLGVVSQVVPLISYAEEIDAEKVLMKFTGAVKVYPHSNKDSVRVQIEFLDSQNAQLLPPYDSGELSPRRSWRNLQDIRIIPKHCRFLKIKLTSYRLGGNANNGYFDGLSLILDTPSERSDSDQIAPDRRLADSKKPTEDLKPEALFEGKSLSKWRSYESENIINGWSVQGGLLHYGGSGGDDLCTKKEYEDFDLSFQWKVGASGNSGVMYRVQRGPEKPFFSGPEYQIIDNKSYSDDPKQHSGAIYDLYANHLDNASAVGAWNVSRIVHRGSKVQHWLNGKLAVTADIGSNDWNSRVAGTNLAKHPRFSKNPRGHIVVQGHKNNNVWFKSIVIKDLSQRHSAKTGEPPADPPTDDTVEFQGKRYLLFPEIVTWEQARLHCEQMGGTLACPASVKENEFLFGLGKKNNRIDALWLGATDQQKEGKWVTSSGKRLAFNQWGPHQPNNKRSKEHFALLILRYSKDRRLAGTWSDQPLVSDAHRPGFVCVWENRPEVKKASGGSTLQKQDLDVGRGAKEKTLDMDSIPDVDGDGWVRLFNGKNLKGWTRRQGTANFRVFNGAIVGETNDTHANSYLCTDRDFGDFELTFEANMSRGNSGVQIRSLSKPNYREGKVHGPQIEIELSPGESGYIYGEATGRQWISKNKPVQNAFVNGQWNRYVIRAKGDRIQTWLNGQPIEDLVDPRSSQTGFIGLQVHSVKGQTGPFQMGWRDIRIREN